MKSWHCRDCGTPRDKFRPSLRAWKLEKLLLEVRNLVIAVESGKYITAEDIATKLRAKKSMVEQCFHRLNLEGILSQGHNIPPHDSTRDRHVWGVGDSSWIATLYMRRGAEQDNDN